MTLSRDWCALLLCWRCYDERRRRGWRGISPCRVRRTWPISRRVYELQDSVDVEKIAQELVSSATLDRVVAVPAVLAPNPRRRQGVTLMYGPPPGACGRSTSSPKKTGVSSWSSSMRCPRRRSSEHRRGRRHRRIRSRVRCDPQHLRGWSNPGRVEPLTRAITATSGVVTYEGSGHFGAKAPGDRDRRPHLRVAGDQCGRECDGGAEVVGPQDGSADVGPVRAPVPGRSGRSSDRFRFCCGRSADDGQVAGCPGRLKQPLTWVAGAGFEPA